MTDEERPLQLSRRGVLSTIAGVGATTAFGAITSTYADTTAAAADSIDDLLLGTFESTFDEWGTDGDVALSRVTRRDRPVAVTEGEYALDVAADGDPAPSISRPITDLALSSHPNVVADVAPGRVDGTDAPIAFRFRLYDPTDALDDLTDVLAGPSDVLDGVSALEPVAESDPVTVPQATPGRIYWDARDVRTRLLDAVSLLEIGWYPVDHDSPDEEFAYRGDVVFDAIRATASVDPVGSAQFATTMRDLQFDHGAYVRTEVTEEFDGGEEGVFVFADDATEPYRFETLASDRFRLTVAGTEIYLGGGWS